MEFSHTLFSPCPFSIASQARLKGYNSAGSTIFVVTGFCMILKQYYLGCLAHASYLLGDEATATAIVVDPQRDIQ
jgi:hypothetical protein